MFLIVKLPYVPCLVITSRVYKERECVNKEEAVLIKKENVLIKKSVASTPSTFSVLIKMRRGLPNL